MVVGRSTPVTDLHLCIPLAAAQIPSSLQSTIARQVHESSQKLDDLINHIHANLASSSPTADKENGTNTSTQPPTISKRLLRVFITQVGQQKLQEVLCSQIQSPCVKYTPLGTTDVKTCGLWQVAGKDKGMWRLRDSAADQYGLPRHTWSAPPAGEGSMGCRLCFIPAVLYCCVAGYAIPCMVITTAICDGAPVMMHYASSNGLSVLRRPSCAGPSPAKAPKAEAGAGKTPAAAAAGRSSLGGGNAAAVPLTLEEAEKSCRPGTMKAAAFAALRTFGAAGARAEEVVAHCIEAGIKTDWTDSGRKALSGVRLCQLGGGGLHTFAPVRHQA